MSFSLIDCQKALHGTDSEMYEPWMMSKLLWFSFMFLDIMCTLQARW